MLVRKALASAAVLISALPGVGAPATARAAVEGEGFTMLASVALPHASDVEVTPVNRRPLAIALSWPLNGGGGTLLVADVRDPRAPRVVASLRCPAGSMIDAVPTSSPALFAVFAASGNGRCLGIDGYGFALVDVSRPARPRVVSSTAYESGGPASLPRSVGRFAATSAVGHPAEPFLYTTLRDGEAGEILVWSLEERTSPELVTRIAAPSALHSVAVDPAGDTLAAGAGTHFVVYDLDDPSAPVQASLTQCPGCTQTTLVRFAGEALVVYDESLNPAACPSGSLYFYALDLPAPRLTGVHNPSRVEPDPTAEPLPRVCAATDVALTPDGTRALLTWEDNSVRLLDLGETAGAGASEAGAGSVSENGWFRVPSGDVAASRWLRDDVVVAADRNLGLHVLEVQAG